MIKRQLLAQLRGAQGPISGEWLSSTLGLSRVSVWKHIQALKNADYHIDATPKGYRLIKSPDMPFAWEFGDREEHFHYYDCIPSTMSVAREKARQGSPEMTIVVAGTQTQGRGRLKRNWQSDEGGLYFTIVLRPTVTPQTSGRIVLYAATTLSKTLKTQFNINAGVKWPNDILVNEKKLAGFLAEMEADFDQVTYLNIGIGINVNNDPTFHEPGATSIRHLLGRPVSRNRLLISFLDSFEENLTAAASNQTIKEWKQWTVTLNRPVRVVTPRSVTEGLAEDVDENGGLIIRKKDGSQKTVVYGDCFHDDGIKPITGRKT